MAQAVAFLPPSIILSIRACCHPTVSHSAEYHTPFTTSHYALHYYSPLPQVRRVAGARTEPGHADGDGAAARFHAIAAITADGGGGLFVADGSFVRHLAVRQEEGDWAGEGAAAMQHQQQQGHQEGANAGSGGSGPGPGRVKPEGAALGAGTGQGVGEAAVSDGDGSSGNECVSRVTVSTIATGPAPWTGLSYDPRSGTLLAATCTAVYRLHQQHNTAAPLPYGPQPPQPPTGGAQATQGQGTGADHGSGSGGQQQSGLQLMLLAGCEGQTGQANGHGPAARFSCITGITVDHNCNAYVTDVVGGSSGGSGGGGVTRIRRVAPDGGVTSAAAPLGAGSAAAAAAAQEVPCPLQDPAILPNGCLAACSYSAQAVWIIALGLQPVQPVRYGGHGGGGRGGSGSAPAAAAARSDRRPASPSRMQAATDREQQGHLRLLSLDLDRLLPPPHRSPVNGE